MFSVLPCCTTTSQAFHQQLLCGHAAQRKGVLDLYGEQALKAGMAESEPGVATY